MNLNTLKTLHAKGFDNLSLEEMVALSAQMRLLSQEYSKVSLEEPIWLCESSVALRSAIGYRVHDDLLKDLRDAERRKNDLLPADFKLSQVDEEIKVLRNKIKDLSRKMGSAA